MSGISTRAGRYVMQPTGYRAFVPAPLPPDPPLQWQDLGLLQLLSRADQAIARLDGVASVIPNPELFVAMYVRREATLSAQIEGTQSSLDNLLEFEADPGRAGIPADVSEIVNYVSAMNYGLDRLKTLPLSLRLIREIHEILLQDTRGSERQPGSFRRSQNWIGPANATLSQASYVPPPPSELFSALDNFEWFLHQGADWPLLVHSALTHAQFETIHPFLDGNGRVGRLLITFLLCHYELLSQPLLYLSHYLKLHRAEYYDRLTAIRERGDWEGWITFFLRGVVNTAEEATTTGREIIQLRQHHLELIRGQIGSAFALPMLDLLYRNPVVNVGGVRDHLGIAFQTANNLVNQYVDLGLLDEITGRSRNRLYRYSEYLDLFTDDDKQFPQEMVETTES